MTNKVIGTLASTDTDFVLVKPSAKLTVDVLKTPTVFSALKKHGAINQEDALSKSAGDTVNFYNLNRVSSNGTKGQVDHYETSVSREYGQRNAVIDQLSYTENYFRRGTITQQRAPFQLSEGRIETMGAWFRNMIDCGILNHLCGNTATSIAQPEVAESAFTGSTLTNITLLNSAIAPTASYKATGSGTDLTDDNVSSSHPLTMQDAMAAMETVTSAYSGIPKWATMTGQGGIWGLWIMSMTGFNQLMNQAQAAGANHTLSQTFYSLIEGGKEPMKWGDFRMIDLPMGLRIMVVPDSMLPRGVASSAAVANTRRSVIVGANALDFAFGAGFQSGGEAQVGFQIRTDEQYKRLNDQTFTQALGILGGKKTQINGFGSNSGTAYDNATYVITHYSAT